MRGQKQEQIAQSAQTEQVSGIRKEVAAVTLYRRNVAYQFPVIFVLDESLCHSQAFRNWSLWKR